VLKAGFRKCHRRPQNRLPPGCELRESDGKIMLARQTISKSSTSTASWFRKTRFTRGRVRELKNAHNAVTVQNRTHFYMNFFDHKDLGNHLLQWCPQVVKHSVMALSVLWF